MIVVSIGRGRHKMLIAEHRHLAEMGAELVELRLDYVVRAVNLKRLLDDRPCPVIITCRRERDGGKWERTEQDRIILLRSAIANGVDYVDLEEDVAGEIPRFGKTKRIISYHNFEETPTDLRAIHNRCLQHDPDVVKIATTANHPRDNLRVLQLISESEVPTVAMCMGEMGIPSRVLGGKYGAPFSYATLHKDRALAPGQLTFQEMREIYHYDEINVETDVYGVIADPVGHSLSPLVHNAAFRHLGLNCVYLPFRIPREDLADFLADTQQMDVKGLSVTIPHKEAVVPHLTISTPAVEKIGVANTIVIDGFDRIGDNTDYTAALESIETTVRQRVDFDLLAGRSALILGAGGAATAVAYALASREVKLIVSSRNPDKASALARRFDGRAVPWNDRNSVMSDMLVNCTPVGMHPHVNDTPYEIDHLSRSMIVFDTIYNPEQTLLIKGARDLGCSVITGVDMFVRQAIDQFKQFTGEQAPEELMRDVVRKSIAAAKL